MSLSQASSAKRGGEIQRAEEKATEAQQKEEEAKDTTNLGRQLTEGALGGLGVGEGLRRFGETTKKIGTGIKKIAGLGRQINRGLRAGKGVARDARSGLRDLARPERSHLTEASRSELDNFAEEGGNPEQVLSDLGIDVDEGASAVDTTSILNPLTALARGAGSQVTGLARRGVSMLGQGVARGADIQEGALSRVAVLPEAEQDAETGFTDIMRLNPNTSTGARGIRAITDKLLQGGEDAGEDAGESVAEGAGESAGVNASELVGATPTAFTQALGDVGDGGAIASKESVADAGDIAESDMTDTEFLESLAKGGITGSSDFTPPPLMTENTALDALRGGLRQVVSANKSNEMVSRVGGDIERTIAKARATSARITNEGITADLKATGKLGTLPDEAGAGGIEGILGEGTGESATTGALDSIGGGLEALGTLEDATGILAPLGVATNIIGAVGLVGGLVTGGVGFYHELTSGLNHAQDEVHNAETKGISVAGNFIIPTSNHSNLQSLR
tara:strand:+ start:1444 stop:2964 length:1521 start_codon:yes stop_codon:yes gene_type:complete